MSRLEWYFQYLKDDPLGFLVYALYFCIVVLTSLILHECAHGYIAYKCGDPTAKMLGRLSLNPAKHLDPIGTACMFFLGFGWAKPVPVNPYNFKNGRKDDFLVSIAGICTNLLLFIICTFLSVIVNRFLWEPDFLQWAKQYFGSIEFTLNPNYVAAYGIMNGNLDQSFLQMISSPVLLYIQRFLLMMCSVNLSLAVFNLLPIPPLDGYHLVNDTLLKGRLNLNRNAFTICQVILIALCMSGALSNILHTLNSTFYSAVLRFFLMITGGV